MKKGCIILVILISLAILISCSTDEYTLKEINNINGDSDIDSEEYETCIETLSHDYSNVSGYYCTERVKCLNCESRTTTTGSLHKDWSYDSSIDKERCDDCKIEFIVYPEDKDTVKNE